VSGVRCQAPTCSSSLRPIGESLYGIPLTRHSSNLPFDFSAVTFLQSPSRRHVVPSGESGSLALLASAVRRPRVRRSRTTCAPLPQSHFPLPLPIGFPRAARSCSCRLTPPCSSPRSYCVFVRSRIRAFVCRRTRARARPTAARVRCSIATHNETPTAARESALHSLDPRSSPARLRGWPDRPIPPPLISVFRSVSLWFAQVCSLPCRAVPPGPPSTWFFQNRGASRDDERQDTATTLPVNAMLSSIGLENNSLISEARPMSGHEGHTCTVAHGNSSS
jgi:hypothetical protein